MPNLSIDWAWLKGTLPGNEGAIPNLGLLYKHLPATRMKCQQILVLDEPNCQRVVWTGKNWTKPDTIEASAFRAGRPAKATK